MTEPERVPRDRTKNFSWADLSSLLPYLRQEVEEVRAGAGRGFDEALANLRKPLERLADHGGDPPVALVQLAAGPWPGRRSPRGAIPTGVRASETSVPLGG